MTWKIRTNCKDQKLKPLPQYAHNSAAPVGHTCNKRNFWRKQTSLRFVKSAYRSTMREDRLNALLLPFIIIRKNISLDYNIVVDQYAKRNQRRMTFINPLRRFVPVIADV